MAGPRVQELQIQPLLQNENETTEQQQQKQQQEEGEEKQNQREGGKLPKQQNQEEEEEEEGGKLPKQQNQEEEEEEEGGKLPKQQNQEEEEEGKLPKQQNQEEEEEGKLPKQQNQEEEEEGKLPKQQNQEEEEEEEGGKLPKQQNQEEEEEEKLPKQQNQEEEEEEEGGKLPKQQNQEEEEEEEGGILPKQQNQEEEEEGKLPKQQNQEKEEEGKLPKQQNQEEEEEEEGGKLPKQQNQEEEEEEKLPKQQNQEEEEEEEGGKLPKQQNQEEDEEEEGGKLPKQQNQEEEEGKLSKQQNQEDEEEGKLPKRQNQQEKEEEEAGGKLPKQQNQEEEEAGELQQHQKEREQHTQEEKPLPQQQEKKKHQEQPASVPEETDLVDLWNTLLHLNKPLEIILIIMTSFSFLGLGCFMGAATRYWLRKDVCTEQYIELIVSKMMKDTAANTSSVLVADSAGIRHDQCLPETEQEWNSFARELNDTEMKLQSKYDERLQRETDIIRSVFNEKIKNVTAELEKTLDLKGENLSSSFNKELQIVKDKAETELRDKTTVLANKQTELDQRLALEPKVMEIRGFMKTETFGPVLLLLGALDVLLVLCVSMLCYQQVLGSRREAAAPASRPSRSASNSPAFKPISTNNSNLAVLYFHREDEQRCRQWAWQLQMGSAQTRPPLMHFINSLDDVQTIPACRAALVFVSPDEREMIIEDHKHHIGRGLRWLAVQRLLDSGVEVFIIIFKDKRDAELLPPGQFFNTELGQINEHDQLKQLERVNHVLSIKNRFEHHQINHIHREFDRIFR